MAQTVLTSYVNEPTVLQPFTIYELDWVQSNVTGLTSTLALGILGNPSSNNVILIDGSSQNTIKTEVSGLPGYSTFSSFYVYYQPLNEILYFPGINFYPDNQSLFFDVNVSYPNPGDPTIFSDGSSHNIMQLRSLSYSPSSGSSTLFEFSELTCMRGDWISVGSGTTLFQNGWSNSYASLSSAFKSAQFKYNSMSQRVELSGFAGASATTSNANTIFTLPTGFRPANTLIVPAFGIDDNGNTNSIVSLEVTTSGNIIPKWISSPTTNLCVMLDGISFSTI